MARTNRYGNQYKPVTDFSGARSDTSTPYGRERRYTQLKKRSVLLLLVAICSGVLYFVLLLVGHFAIPPASNVAVQVIFTVVLAASLFLAVGSAFAALIVRLVAALKR
ncbi:hypothetical protein [Brevibacterium sp. ZH18]|uniref:hypothetical protein n=1 Tax=Brevibacterium sp. ZH18 TaxID=2927784 RepID=UPI001F60E744|nr:hypothetical protein [Brevibacterium sp. ZH18]MCI4012382.1 hypothetical protein [Brevibacterium sp. ZH18]